MYVVESTENDEAVAEIVGSRDVAVDDTLTAETERLRRLKFLPTSLPRMACAVRSAAIRPQRAAI